MCVCAERTDAGLFGLPGTSSVQELTEESSDLHFLEDFDGWLSSEASVKKTKV